MTACNSHTELSLQYQYIHSDVTGWVKQLQSPILFETAVVVLLLSSMLLLEQESLSMFVVVTIFVILMFYGGW